MRLESTVVDFLFVVCVSGLPIVMSLLILASQS
jgi:hypothetical protein